MNASVQADVLTLNVLVKLVDAKIVTVSDNHTKISIVRSVCLPLRPVSVNGHSLSGINPESLKVGELATSILA